MRRLMLLVPSLLLAALVACSEDDDTTISRLLTDEGRELMEAEFQQVVGELSNALVDARSIRQERIAPDPREQCDGCPAQIDIVRREDGAVVSRALAALVKAEEEEVAEYSLTCPGVDAAAYVIYRSTGGAAWTVDERQGERTYGDFLTGQLSRWFPAHPPQRITTLGRDNGRFTLEIEMEDEIVRMTLDRDGQVLESESQFTFEGGQRIVYRFDYDPDISIELPAVQAQLACP